MEFLKLSEESLGDTFFQGIQANITKATGVDVSMLNEKITTSFSGVAANMEAAAEKLKDLGKKMSEGMNKVLKHFIKVRVFRVEEPRISRKLLPRTAKARKRKFFRKKILRG